jgi:hypothetical protein
MPVPKRYQVFAQPSALAADLVDQVEPPSTSRLKKVDYEKISRLLVD